MASAVILVQTPCNTLADMLVSFCCTFILKSFPIQTIVLDELIRLYALVPLHTAANNLHLCMLCFDFKCLAICHDRLRLKKAIDFNLKLVKLIVIHADLQLSTAALSKSDSADATSKTCLGRAAEAEQAKSVKFACHGWLVA